MTSLYNMRHAGDQYRVTKFDSHYEAESSYLCTESECECPAGFRPSCRHRQMLSKFIQRDMIGKNFFFDFDRGGWVQGPAEWEGESEQEQAPTTIDPSPAGVDLLAGIQTFDLESNEYLNGTLPRAVPASPTGSDLPKSLPTIRRRV